MVPDASKTWNVPMCKKADNVKQPHRIVSLAYGTTKDGIPSAASRSECQQSTQTHAAHEPT